MPASLSPLSLVSVAAIAFGLLPSSGCSKKSDAMRRASDEATAEAEDVAQRATVTNAVIESNPSKNASQGSSEDAARAKDEMIAAFRLEQSDYRDRLQHLLDQLDVEILHARATRRAERQARELRARRDLLKHDLQAVDRSTEPDWATLRAKVERDLEDGGPGTQVLQPTEQAPGEP